MPDALPIVAANHVALTARRLAECRKFYRDVLGFREVSRPNFDFEGAWLYNYGLMIHLIHNANVADGSPEISGRVQHLALAVNDMEESERLLNEHGIRYMKSEIKDRGIKQIFFHDPDGNTVEIAVYPPTPPYVKTS